MKACAICKGEFKPHPRARTAETRTLCALCRKWVKEIQKSKHRG